jgi:hypothetical protein
MAAIFSTSIVGYSNPHLQKVISNQSFKHNTKNQYLKLRSQIIAFVIFYIMIVLIKRKQR